MKDLLFNEISTGDLVLYTSGKVRNYRTSIFTGKTSRDGKSLTCIFPDTKRSAKELIVISEEQHVKFIYNEHLYYKKHEEDDGIIRVYGGGAYDFDGETDGTYRGLIIHEARKKIEDSRMIKGVGLEDVEDTINAVIDVLEEEYVIEHE